MALANLIAKAEAHYTKFETRKTARLTKRAEKLALTPEQRTAMLAYDTVVAEAIERGDEETAERVSKEQATNRASLTKAERAAKKAEKAIRTREIKVMRRKARIAAVRYYLSSHTISETVTHPDGTQTEVKVEPPVEVTEGVADWQRLAVKAGGVFTYPTRLFKRMWTWARKPISKEIPLWRRPSKIVRTVVTAAVIAVLAVPVYVVSGVLSVANFLAYGVLSVASVLAYGALALVWLVGQALGVIPFIGRYLKTAVNVLVALVGGLFGLALILAGVAIFAVNYLVNALITGALMVIGSPIHAILALHTKAVVWRFRRGVKNGNVQIVEIDTEDLVDIKTDDVMAAMDEVAEALAEAVAEAFAEPVVEEPVLEGVVMEPKPAPRKKATPRAKRRTRPVTGDAAVA